jgi:RHS repeat-associated protein
MQTITRRDEEGIATEYDCGYSVSSGQVITAKVSALPKVEIVGRSKNTSVCAVVNNDSEVVGRGNYTSYGERTIMNPAYGVCEKSEIGQEFGYTGRKHDAEDTGLMYFRARYYSGELGRFVGRDPLGTPLDPDYFENQKLLLEIIDWFRTEMSFFELASISNTGVLLRFTDGTNLYRGYFVPGKVDPSGKIVGGIIKLGRQAWKHRAKIKKAWQRFKKWKNRNKPNSNPKKGKPNSTKRCYNKKGNKKQDRKYDENGDAKEDIDYDHYHDGHKPHKHYWKDGKREKDGFPLT